MPRGDKSKYSVKQKRKAEKIENSYRGKGLSKDEAQQLAWATVNKIDKGGKNPGGSGRGKTKTKEPDRHVRGKLSPRSRRKGA